MFCLRHCLVVILILVSGCSINANVILEEIPEESIQVSAYFCPRDSCENVTINSIKNAQNSLHCAFFDIDSGDIINAIAKKSHSADVKVVIDKNNYEGQIKGPGIKIADSKQYMHNKFCIIDNKIVMTGSTNPTNNDLNINNNNIVIIKSEYIAENYEDEFDELWNGVYATGDKVKYNKVGSDNLIIENYFCPEDNCRDKVLESIRNAEKSVYFMTFSFTDEDIADEVLFSNLETKGIFEALQAGSQYSQFDRLRGFGIDVKKDKNKKNMHHKVFIIDNETVITGSYNPTGSGNLRNDENIVVIHNRQIASRFLEEFEFLWQ